VYVIVDAVLYRCREVMYNSPPPSHLGTKPKPEVQKLGKGVMQIALKFYWLTLSVEGSIYLVRLL